MKIAIGTTNPIKVAGITEAFTLFFNNPDIVVTNYDVDSGVADQPIGNKEIKLGAFNRAKKVLLENESANYGIGCEGGISQIEEIYFNYTWVCIVDRTGSEYYGVSNHIPVSNELMELINSGMNLAQACKQVYKIENLGQKEGYFGLMTNGNLTREEITKHATLSAISQIAHAI